MTRLIDRTGQRFGRWVVVSLSARRSSSGGALWNCVCDCGNRVTVQAHDLATGHTTSCGCGRRKARKTIVQYSAAHDRVRRERGWASEYDCVDCGQLAEEWSYNHADPDELIEPEGCQSGGSAYSLDSNCYDPRCIPCHRRFDSDFEQPKERRTA